MSESSLLSEIGIGIELFFLDSPISDFKGNFMNGGGSGGGRKFAHPTLSHRIL